MAGGTGAPVFAGITFCGFAGGAGGVFTTGVGGGLLTCGSTLRRLGRRRPQASKAVEVGGVGAAGGVGAGAEGAAG